LVSHGNYGASHAPVYVPFADPAPANPALARGVLRLTPRDMFVYSRHWLDPVSGQWVQVSLTDNAQSIDGLDDRHGPMLADEAAARALMASWTATEPLPPLSDLKLDPLHEEFERLLTDFADIYERDWSRKHSPYRLARDAVAFLVGHGFVPVSLHSTLEMVIEVAETTKTPALLVGVGQALIPHHDLFKTPECSHGTFFHVELRTDCDGSQAAEFRLDTDWGPHVSAFVSCNVDGGHTGLTTIALAVKMWRILMAYGQETDLTEDEVTP
jgi:hypothetical protein